MNRNANRMAFALAISLLLVSAGMAQIGEKPAAMDTKTVRQWSVPYRGWRYYPDHVIPGKPNIKGYEAVQMTDVPTVFQLPGDKRWYMTFIGFDGKGYQSFVAQSADLVQVLGAGE